MCSTLTFPKGASPNYFGKDNVILTLGEGGGGGGGGGVRLVTFSDVLNKTCVRTPTTFDINDVMRGGGGGGGGIIMKSHNDVIFFKYL